METANLQIAIIGAGNMGGAIARGLAKGKLIQSKNIRVSDVSQANLDAIKAFDAEITVSTSNRDMIEGADIIMLAVKPWLVEVIAEEIENKINYEKQIIVSIAAGVDFGKMVELFDKQATIFRVIPNTAIDVLQSVSTISSFNAKKEQEELVVAMFAELGKAFLVPVLRNSVCVSLYSCSYGRRCRNGYLSWCGKRRGYSDLAWSNRFVGSERIAS